MKTISNYLSDFDNNFLPIKENMHSRRVLIMRQEAIKKFLEKALKDIADEAWDKGWNDGYGKFEKEKKKPKFI